MAQPKPVKVCTLGESGAGKSSLIMRLTTGNFSSNQQTTIGAAFVAWTSPDGKTRLEIWDTAGQERYATLAPMYYRNAAGILVVYDMTERASFERAVRWLTELPSTMPADTVLILPTRAIWQRREMLRKRKGERPQSSTIALDTQRQVPNPVMGSQRCSNFFVNKFKAQKRHKLTNAL